MDLCGLFRALGDPLRFRIVEVLVESPKTVTALVDLVGAPQPNVSRHLKSLRERGVIESRRRGKWIEYSINREALRAIRGWLDASGRSAGRSDSRRAEADQGGSDDPVLFGG